MVISRGIRVGFLKITLAAGWEEMMGTRMLVAGEGRGLVSQDKGMGAVRVIRKQNPQDRVMDGWMCDHMQGGAEVGGMEGKEIARSIVIPGFLAEAFY